MDLQSPKTTDSLRAHADGLDLKADEVLRQARAGADQLIREAEANADELRRRAQDYRTVAADLDTRQTPMVCRTCHAAITRDALGWRHVAETACPVAEPVELPVAGQPPAPAAPSPAVADGEVAQS